MSVWGREKPPRPVLSPWDVTLGGTRRAARTGIFELVFVLRVWDENQAPQSSYNRYFFKLHLL